MALSNAEKLGIYGSIASVTAQRKLVELMGFAKGGVAGATFTVGASHTDTVNVAVQLTDEAGADVVGPASVTVLLLTTAAGVAFNTLTLTTALAIGTDGALTELVTDEVSTVVTEADGEFDIDIKYTTGAGTLFVAVVLPNGILAVSTVVTFTA